MVTNLYDKGLKWEKNDLGQAMANAVFRCAGQKNIKRVGDKLMFNGFWRNGDKLNVCIWQNEATWHDAKTGEGGGCKEFAKIAFNMDLPEFMNGFALKTDVSKIAKPVEKKVVTELSLPIDKLWASIIKADQSSVDESSQWLSKKRGFLSPRKVIGSGFANLNKDCLNLFEVKHQDLIKQRIELGPQIIVPIRGAHSDKELNLFFRAISNVAKEDKSRLLTGAGGWSSEDGSPRAFGFPGRIKEFPNLVICEGMADYFAAEYLLYGDEKYLPLGASNASALIKWAQWLAEKTYEGRIILIYQLDTNESGLISTTATGQSYAIKAMKILKTANIKAELFKWPQFLTSIPNYRKMPADIAEVFADVGSQREFLSEIFFRLHGEIKK
jgi:hypothetical protein